MDINIKGSFWDWLWKIFEWFKIRKAEKRAAQAERDALNAETILDQKTDMDKVHEEHGKVQDEIKDLKDGADIADSFNKL
jgi:hypothetical protein